jgi:biotin transport system substrate-specific component
MRKNHRLRDLTRMSLTVALLCICAWIALPGAVPFTLQSFAVFFALAYLGWRRALGTYAAYLALGAVGLPVFSGFQGGAAVLVGATGGYLLGFLLGIPLAGLLLGRAEKPSLGRQIAASAVALAVCYVFGTVWYWLLFLPGSGLAGVWSAALLCVLPYLLPDAAKLALAIGVAKRLS